MEGLAARVGGAVVQGVHLDASNVRVLSVLVVLLHMHLDDPAAEGLTIWSATNVEQRNILPSNRADEGHVGKLDEIMLTGAGIEGDVGGRVGFVLLVVNKKADGPDFNTTEKVDGEQVRLLTVRPAKNLLLATSTL